MASKRRKRRGSRPPQQQQRPDHAAVAEKPAAEPARRRTARNEPPPAPWGSFPLSELTIFVGLVMLIMGFFSGGNQGLVLIGVGVVLGSLGGLEVSVREHFAGYRSHTLVLALAAGVLTAAAITVVTTLAFDSVLLVIPMAAGIVMFAAAFYVLRGAFRRASGGLSFKVGGLRG
jgi:hypothetical protein